VIESDLSQLDVFYGDLTVNRAHVYARLPRPAADAGLTLTGQVRGPRCLHSETLPMSSPLVDQGPGPTLLAAAILPEPCFWSPDLPAIYDVVIRLQRGSEVITTARREIGLRSFGVRGRHLALEGKHWVLRGVAIRSASSALPRAWHEASAVYVVTEADDHQLGDASQWGAMAVVEVRGTGDEMIVGLRRLALHPAVAVAVIHGDWPPGPKPAVVAPNVLLAQPIDSGGKATVQSWASLLWVDASNPRSLERLLASCEIPIVAVRRLGSPLPLERARAACDQLQSDLATIGQFAGYVV
jgi:hypothetical protein